MTVDGEQRPGSGAPIDVVQPHRHAAVLGTTREAATADVQAAVDAALGAARAWQATSYDDRAAVLLRAADLLAGPWRDTLNAATMLGQSKTVFQAEIDSACELIDFLRFNVAFGRQILEEQPVSSTGVWNRTDHRPLEGFVLAITPFNFTAIAGNLPLAPALMGNPVVWKPSPTQQFSAHFVDAAARGGGHAAGRGEHGDRQRRCGVRGRACRTPSSPGSTSPAAPRPSSTCGSRSPRGCRPTAATPGWWGRPAARTSSSRTARATRSRTEVALVRGAFEYQGQKCSAASRAYVPRSMWEGGLRDGLADRVRSLTYGDVTDLSNFGGAVIDRRAFDRLSRVVRSAADDPSLEVLAGGSADDSVGFFVDPTVLVSEDPSHDVFSTEYFGPVLAVHVYDDADWTATLDLVDRTAPYALTGAVIADDPYAVAEASARLRFTAGNFYVNDKPTGAVVGQQPFGGARQSGTNDKAGSALNLLRWTSPRTLKTTFVPARGHGYPHMG